MAAPVKAPSKGKGSWWAGLSPKAKAAVGVGGGIGAYLLYRWYSNRNSSSTTSTASTAPANSGSGTSGQGWGSGGGGSGNGWQGNWQGGWQGWPWSVNAANPGTAGTSTGTTTGSGSGTTTGSGSGTGTTTGSTSTGTAPSLGKVLVPAGYKGPGGSTYGKVSNSGTQIAIPSANGPQTLTLAPGTSLQTPVTVAGSGGSVRGVPLTDTISTGSANSLSSAVYTTPYIAAQASQSLNPVTPTVTTTPSNVGGAGSLFGPVGGNTRVTTTTPNTSPIPVYGGKPKNNKQANQWANNGWRG